MKGKVCDSWPMERSSLGKQLSIILAAHLAVTSLTWWDLYRRAPQQVRGSKRGWRIASGANTFGSAAYYLVGRKGSGQPPKLEA